MAYADFAALSKDTATAAPCPEQIIIEPQTEQAWRFYLDGKWVGPFSFNTLMRMNVLKEDTLIRSEEDPRIHFARDDATLQEMIAAYAAKKEGGICRHCFNMLDRIDYEAPLLICRRCKGLLISIDRLKRILIRENRVFGDETVRRARLIEKTAAALPPRPAVRIVKATACPRCVEDMERRFYSPRWPVEVDWCST